MSGELMRTLEAMAGEIASHSSHLKDLERLERQGGLKSWTTTVTGLDTNQSIVSVCRYMLTGKHFYFNVYISGTSNSTAFQITLPFTSANISNVGWTGAIGNIWDNGVAQTTAGRWVVSANSNVLAFRRDMVQSLWTVGGSKSVRAQGFYEIA